ncbi:hypothetical protein TNCV_3037231 [Trichonephila clavipes]|nr:hypothetical protein TNCV_3037231 [Trichonephila clavipes]
MSRRVACQTLGHRKCPFAQSFTHPEQRSQSINRYRTPRFSTDHRFLEEMSRLESYLDRLVRRRPFMIDPGRLMNRASYPPRSKGYVEVSMQRRCQAF